MKHSSTQPVLMKTLTPKKIQSASRTSENLQPTETSPKKPDAPQNRLATGNAISPRPRPAFEIHMFIIFGLIFITALAIFTALRLGADYYLAALAERPQHPLHNLLKPSGLIGQGFGVVGGLFCVLTLLYPIRKRWRLLENLGTPRTWFQFHVYFGIAGPLLATLHTTFKFGGLASISFWSMIIVMASGFVGRFLFAQLPRNRRGVILSLKEIEAEIRVVQQALADDGLNDTLFVDSQDSHKVGRTSGWRTLFRLMIHRRRSLRRWNRRLSAQHIPASATRRMLPLLSRKFFLESSRMTLELTTKAFSLWHTLHLPFTYVMFLTLIIHVGLAIFLGYTWIF